MSCATFQVSPGCILAPLFPLDAFFFSIWQCCATRRIFSSQTRIKLMTPAVEVHGSLTTRLPRSSQEAIAFCFNHGRCWGFFFVCFLTALLLSSQLWKVEGPQPMPTMWKQVSVQRSPLHGLVREGKVHVTSTWEDSAWILASSALGPLYLLYNCCHLTDDKSRPGCFTLPMLACHSFLMSECLLPLWAPSRRSFVSLGTQLHRVGV